LTSNPAVGLSENWETDFDQVLRLFTSTLPKPQKTHLMSTSKLFLLAFLGAGILSGCGKKFDDGLVKHQVTGQVLVNGEPVKGMVVAFWHTDVNVPGNGARPIAVTDDQGKYALTTNGTNDGAVAGDYHVSFFWPRGNTRDVMNDLYASRCNPDFKVTVDEKGTEIPPFELTVPEKIVEAQRKFYAKDGNQNGPSD